MSEPLLLMFDPAHFFKFRIGRPAEMTVPLALVLIAAGLASASINLVSADYARQLPEGVQIFFERLGYVRSGLYITVYTLMWPLIAGAIGLSAVLFWNAEVHFKKLVELVGYAYFPFVLAGVSSFILLWAMPVEVIPSDQLFNAGAFTAALERSPAFSAARVVQAAARAWFFLLTVTALSELAGVRWLRSAACVACPCLTYIALQQLSGI